MYAMRSAIRGGGRHCTLASWWRRRNRRCCGVHGQARCAMFPSRHAMIEVCTINSPRVRIHQILTCKQVAQLPRQRWCGSRFGNVLVFTRRGVAASETLWVVALPPPAIRAHLFVSLRAINVCRCGMPNAMATSARQCVLRVARGSGRPAGPLQSATTSESIESISVDVDTSGVPSTRAATVRTVPQRAWQLNPPSLRPSPTPALPSWSLRTLWPDRRHAAARFCT